MVAALPMQNHLDMLGLDASSGKQPPSIAPSWRHEKRKSRRRARSPGAPPAPRSQATDPVNLTDKDSCIMVVGGGFDQCFYAQAVVDCTGFSGGYFR
jgi:hypothetical protein